MTNDEKDEFIPQRYELWCVQLGTTDEMELRKRTDDEVLGDIMDDEGEVCAAPVIGWHFTDRHHVTVPVVGGILGTPAMPMTYIFGATREEAETRALRHVQRLREPARADPGEASDHT